MSSVWEVHSILQNGSNLQTWELDIVAMAGR